jgi:hypothetical protein
MCARRARHTESQVVVVAINRSGETVSQEVSAPAGMALGDQLVDRLDPARPAVAVSGNSFSITLAPRSAAILAAP